jgi:hypothetical protein
MPNQQENYSRRVIERTREVIRRAEETIRRSRETLRVSREIQADRNKAESLKVALAKSGV